MIRAHLRALGGCLLLALVATAGGLAAEEGGAGAASPGSVIEGLTRRAGVPSPMRVEVRRLPVEPALVPLADEQGRRARFEDWLLPGFVEGAPVAAVSSDARGAYRVTGLARGHYEVRAVAADGARAFAPATVRSHGGVQIVDLGVEPGGERLTGRVRYADGRPFAGWLQIVQHEDDRRASPWLKGADVVGPDAEGRFEARGLLASRVEVVAVVPGRLRIRCGSATLPREGPLAMLVDEGTAEVEGQVLDPQGRPVAGVPVVLWSARERGGPVLAGATTDAEGRVRLPCGPGQRNFTVRAPGLEMSAALEWPGEGTGFVARLVPAALLGGVVRVAGTSTPAAGAWVHAVSADERFPQPPQVARADAEGRFRFEAPRLNGVLIFVAGGGWIAKDHATASAPAIFAPGPTLGLVLEAVPGARVSGRVLDDAGAPLENVEVWAEPGVNEGHRREELRLLGAPGPAVSDAEGRYALDSLLPGRVVDLKVQHPFLHQRLFAFEAHGMPGATIDVPLQRFENLTGRVELPPGVLARRVEVTQRAVEPELPPGMKELPEDMRRGFSMPEGRVTLAPDGSFRLRPTAAGPTRVRAMAWVGEVPCAAEATLTPGAAEHVLKLVPEKGRAAWLVHVLDPEGRPVVGGWAKLEFRAPGVSDTRVVRIEDGIVSFQAESTAGTLTVMLYGFADQDEQPLPYASLNAMGLKSGVHSLRLAAGRTLKVHVRTPEGLPVADVTAVAWPVGDSGSSGTQATSGADGDALLTGLGQGVALRVEVEPPAGFVRAMAVEVPGDASEVSITLTPLFAARIVVTREDGRPVAGASVCAGPAVHGRTAFRAGAVRLVTEADGACVLPALDPGVRVELSVETSEPDLLPSFEAAWRLAHRTLVLARADVLRGRVLDAGGKPVADATVWFRPAPGTPPAPPRRLSWWQADDGFALGALTGSDGSFAIEQLPPGEVEISAAFSGPDGHVRKSARQSTSTGAHDLTLTLAPP